MGQKYDVDNDIVNKGYHDIMNDSICGDEEGEGVVVEAE